MDYDWIFACDAIERLKKKLDETETGNREKIADEIITAVNKIIEENP